VQGRELGRLQSANALARVVGPVAAGVALSAGGAPAAFLGAAACGVTAGLLGLLFGRSRKV